MEDAVAILLIRRPSGVGVASQIHYVVVRNRFILASVAETVRT